MPNLNIGPGIRPDPATFSDVHPRYRVLLADDHELVLDMLRSLLEHEFEVVGAASDGSTLLRLAQELDPDLILVDVVMPGLNGLEAGRMLQAYGSRAKLVYLTMETDPAVAAEAFAFGASAYLSKVSPVAELQTVLRLVAGGGRYLTPAIANGDIAALCALHATNPVMQLSPREREVLRHLVTGMSMKAVARLLNIAPRTVAFHKYRAMETLGQHGNSDLVDFAIRHGLLAVRVTQHDGDHHHCPSSG
ncbi:MAG TPA: response regulator transcription factor [Terriglobales bacterium]|nr:response regulator transcription factor [Terriglobales bacterium]